MENKINVDISLDITLSYDSTQTCENKVALLVIDMQKDFVARDFTKKAGDTTKYDDAGQHIVLDENTLQYFPTEDKGSLHGTGADDDFVKTVKNKIAAFKQDNPGCPIIISQDYHPKDHTSFFPYLPLDKDDAGNAEEIQPSLKQYYEKALTANALTQDDVRKGLPSHCVALTNGVHIVREVCDAAGLGYNEEYGYCEPNEKTGKDSFVVRKGFKKDTESFSVIRSQPNMNDEREGGKCNYDRCGTPFNGLTKVVHKGNGVENFDLGDKLGFDKTCLIPGNFPELCPPCMQTCERTKNQDVKFSEYFITAKASNFNDKYNEKWEERLKRNADVDTVEQLLESYGITKGDKVQIVGLVSNMCVMSTAIDAKNLGYKVEILADATRPAGTPDKYIPSEVQTASEVLWESKGKITITNNGELFKIPAETGAVEAAAAAKAVEAAAAAAAAGAASTSFIEHGATPSIEAIHMLWIVPFLFGACYIVYAWLSSKKKPEPKLLPDTVPLKSNDEEHDG